MFGLGFGEIILVLVVALLVLGPEKLPKLAKQLGRGMREFRRAASDFQATLQDADPTRTHTRPKTPTKAPEGTIDANQALVEGKTVEPEEAAKPAESEPTNHNPEEQA